MYPDGLYPVALADFILCILATGDIAEQSSSRMSGSIRNVGGTTGEW
jgi:hypothetical protein